MKVTDEQFDRFRNAVDYWLDRFGLHQYGVYVDRCDSHEAYATISVDEEEKVAKICQCRELNKDTARYFNPEGNALHEVLHLVLHRICWLGSQRYIERSDLDEEWEAAVRRLEHGITSRS